MDYFTAGYEATRDTVTLADTLEIYSLKGERVFEFGAGFGGSSQFFLDQGMHVIVAETGQEKREKLKTILPEDQIHEEGLCWMEENPCSVDLVYANMLEPPHCEIPPGGYRRFLTLAETCLRPEGRVLLNSCHPTITRLFAETGEGAYFDTDGKSVLYWGRPDDDGMKICAFSSPHPVQKYLHDAEEFQSYVDYHTRLLQRKFAETRKLQAETQQAHDLLSSCFANTE